jgi:hypothetical protein
VVNLALLSLAFVDTVLRSGIFVSTVVIKL